MGGTWRKCRAMLSLIAQASDLPPPNSAAAVGWIVLTIAAVCVALNQVLGLYFTLKPRKSPPDHEIYATKAELAAAKEEHQANDTRIEERCAGWMEQQQTQHSENMHKLDQAMSRFEEWQLTIERALGIIGTKAEIALEAKGKK